MSGHQWFQRFYFLTRITDTDLFLSSSGNAPDVVEESTEDHKGDADTKEKPKTKNEEREDKRISDQNVHDLTLETSHSVGLIAFVFWKMPELKKVILTISY